MDCRALSDQYLELPNLAVGECCQCQYDRETLSFRGTRSRDQLSWAITHGIVLLAGLTGVVVDGRQTLVGGIGRRVMSSVSVGCFLEASRRHSVARDSLCIVAVTSLDWTGVGSTGAVQCRVQCRTRCKTHVLFSDGQG